MPKATSDGDRIPRSLGELLRVLREDAELNQQEMFKALRDHPGIEPRYRQELGRVRDNSKKADEPSVKLTPEEHEAKDLERGGNKISRWESCKQDVPYAAVHCYAKYFGLSTVTLLFIGRRYAHLRDAANASNEVAMREEFGRAEERMTGLKRVQEVFKRLERSFIAKGYREGLRGQRIADDDDLLERRTAVMQLLIDACRDRGRWKDEDLGDLFASFRV